MPQGHLRHTGAPGWLCEDGRVFTWRRDLPAEPGGAGVTFAFTSRRGGVECAPLGRAQPRWHHGGRRPSTSPPTGPGSPPDSALDPRHLVFMDQVHGRGVAVVDGPSPGEAPSVDALVTRHTELALAALVADCVPVLLADRAAGVVAAVHAGRPGLAAGVVEAAVEAMEREGAQAGALDAVVGPSVCGRCYEVPEAMRAEVAAVSPVSATVSWTGTPALDIAAGVVERLRRAGATVTWVPGCTREDPDLYSYRRDGRTGRFAGVVRLIGNTATSVTSAATGPS